MKTHYVLIIVLLAFAHPVYSATTEVAAFWTDCREQNDTLPVDHSYRVRHFGDSAALANLLLQLILDGEKTGTFNTPWLYEGNRNLTPIVGGYTVLTDFNGRPGALLRTTSVETRPFSEITEADTQYEGPNARSLDVWREIHWHFFASMLEDKGRVPTQDMPVSVERFEVVCVGAG